MKSRFFYLSFVPLLLFSLSANAAWDYVAYANGEMMADVFEGIKSIIYSNPSYRTVIVVIAVPSFIWVVAKSAFDGKFIDIAIYMIIVVLGMNLLFRSTIDVLVTDPFDASATYNVTEVPMLIGLPVVAVNAIGTELTTTYETNFSNMDPLLNISSGAAPGSMSRILRDLATVRIGDVRVRGNLTNYYQDCVLPMIYNGTLSVEDIAKSADVLATIRSTHVARYTMITPAAGGEQEATTCRDAWTDVNTSFTAASAGSSDNWYQIIDNTQSIGNDALRSAFGSSIADTTILDAAIAQGTGTATSGSVFLSNMLVGNGLEDGIKAAAAASGSNEVLMSLNMDQARRAQEMSWWTSGELFQDMSGYFYATMNVLIVALTPLLMLAFFIPKVGMKVIGMYFKVLIWLALWWPGLAIVNYMSSMYLGNQIAGGQGTCFGCGPGSITDANMTSAFAAKAASATGFLATIVPMLMWGIVSGSAHALVGALQQASGKQQAGEAAKNIATDSYQSDNISYNNTASNKHDDTATFATGNQASVLHSSNAAANIREYASSSDVDKGGSTVENKIAMAQESQLKEVTEKKAEIDTSLQAGLTTATSNAVSTLNNYGSVVDGKWEWKSQETYESNKSEIDAAVNELATTQAYAKDTSHQASDEAAAALSASISSDKAGFIGKVLGAVGIEGKAGASTTTRSTDSELETAKDQETNSVANRNQVSTGESGSEGVSRGNAITDSTSSSTTDSSNLTNTESRVSSMIDKHSEALKELESVEESIKTSQSRGYNEDMTLDEYESIRSEYQATLDSIDAKQIELEGEYRNKSEDVLAGHANQQDATQQDLANAGAKLEIEKDVFERRADSTAGQKADLLSKNYNGMADQHSQSIMTEDKLNEQNLASGRSANNIDIGNGVTAVPMGVANIDDGKGGYKTEVVYDFKKDGESVGSGALQRNDNGGINIVEGRYASNDQMASDMAAYQQSGKVHSLGEAIGGNLSGVANYITGEKIGRDVGDANVFDGRSYPGGLVNGTISGGKLDIGSSPQMQLTGSTMNGVPDSNGRVANTSINIGIASGDKRH